MKELQQQSKQEDSIILKTPILRRRSFLYQKVKSWQILIVSILFFVFGIVFEFGFLILVSFFSFIYAMMKSNNEIQTKKQGEKTPLNIKLGKTFKKRLLIFNLVIIVSLFLWIKIENNNYQQHLVLEKQKCIAQQEQIKSNGGDNSSVPHCLFVGQKDLRKVIKNYLDIFSYVFIVNALILIVHAIIIWVRKGESVKAKVLIIRALLILFLLMCFYAVAMFVLSPI